MFVRAKPVKIIYVTASLPYGVTEVFALPEMRELVRRGHDLKIVPVTRYSAEIHSDAEPFLVLTDYEALLSKNVLKAAPTGFVRSPIRAVGALSRTLVGLPERWMVRKNLGSFPKSMWLADLARRWGAEHIHAYWASVAATMAMTAGETSGVPWSFTAHRWDIETPNAFPAKVDSARFVRFISEDGLELARPVAGPALEQKAEIIRMGVPLSNRPLEKTAPPPGVQLRVICTGSLIPRKGQRFLLEAVHRLQTQGINVQVSFAGNGPEQDALVTQAQVLGITEQVTFLGNVDHTELLDSYSEGRYDAFVLPSLHEGISIALIEAMSRGLPAIATDVGGTRELLTAGSGQLIPPEDVESLASALTLFARNEPERRREGEAGRARVMADYDIRGVVDKLEAKFQAARSSPRTAPK